MIPGSANSLLLTSSGDDGYKIERSLRFNSADSAYLNRTPSAAGNRKTFTLSTWFKKVNTGSGAWDFIFSAASNSGLFIDFNGSNNHFFTFYDNSFYVNFEGSFRDPSAWYHIVLAFDSTQATNSNRVKLYVNGVQLNYSTSGLTWPSQNEECNGFNAAVSHVFGRWNYSSGSRYLDAYLADAHFIDGQALTPTDFGEFDSNNVWQAKKFSGSYELGKTSTTSNWVGQTTGTAAAADSIAGNAFDGNSSTKAGATANSSFNFTPTSPITGITKVRINAKREGTVADILLNGSSIKSSWSSGEDAAKEFIVNNLTSLEWQNDSNGYWIAVRTIEVEINGAFQFLIQNNNSFHLDFADNSTVSALGTDTSGNGNNWTVNNLSAGVTPTYGIAFDGNDRVEFPGTTFTGDLTIECFVKGSSYAGNVRIFSVNQGVNNNEKTNLRAYNGAHEFYFGTGSYVSDYGTTMPVNVWNHIAVTRSGSTVSYYMNGTRLGTDTYSGSVLCTSMVLAHGYGSEYFTGQISNARIVNGQALYTGASYTVPTGPLTTTSQGATASNVTHLLANTSSATANGGTGAAGTAGGDPTVVSGITFVSAAFNDSLVDTPNNYGEDTGLGGEVRGNYCTWNPLSKNNQVLSDGNLNVTSSSSGRVNGTMAVSSGKWYFETTLVTASQYTTVGVASTERTDMYPGQEADSYVKTLEFGTKMNNSVQPLYGSTFSSGDIFQLAMDLDNGKLYFGKNGTWEESSNPTTGANPVYTLPAGTYRPIARPYGGSAVISTNFGQRAWVHTPPSGYKALCTQNLDDPLVEDPSKYFDTKLWTGNSSTQTISGLNFEPDLLFYKARNVAYNWGAQDSVRGVGKTLSPNGTSTEYTESTGLTGFTSDGFTLDGSGYYIINYSGTTMAGFAWDAGSSNTSIAAGGLNSAAYDSSQTWSNYVTISEGNTGSNYNTNATNAFDGNTSTSTSLYSGNMVSPYSPTTVVFTPPSAITVSTGVRVYIATNRGQQIKVNGTQTNSSVSAGWNTVSFTGSLTSLTIGPSNAGSSSNIAVIEINGTVLLDSGVTPPTNVPTIASTVRANPSAGFSIVTYTGNGSASASIAHGLNKAPEMFIVKSTSDAYSWFTYHKDLGNGNLVALNSSGASGGTGYWANKTPTSNEIFLDGNVNTEVAGSGKTFVCYCFTSVEGYCKVGTFQGNASSPGPFVYTGFRPQFLLVKSTISGWWNILDATRDTYNPVKSMVFPNSSSAEYSGAPDRVNFLSNGFNVLSGSSDPNQNSPQIYLAIAEHPFKTSRAR